jgi:hypothetical protein
MKRLLTICFLALAGCLHAQGLADPNEGSVLTTGSAPGTLNFSWFGHAGRTYFIQQSTGLTGGSWKTLPVIASGSDQVITWGVTPASPALFLRLKYNDAPTVDPYRADFDGDGVSNWNEVRQGTDPLSAALDVNGLPFDWETFFHIPFGTDLNALAAQRAQGATDLIVADLQKEMTNSSTVSSSGSYTWLMPISAASMVPIRAMKSSMASDPNFINLIKQSGLAGAGGMIPAGTVPTTAAAMDGSSVGGSRWSAPQLTGSATGPVNFSDAQVPNWTLMTRAGVPASQAWNTAFQDPVISNSNYVIGRFAFNVYDEGGLLDVNVAGSPASIVSGSDASLKGSLGFADLSLIPGITNADTFIKSWRNRATGQFATDYLAYLGFGDANNLFYGVGPKYGFLLSATTAIAGDNRLLGRQDLIRLVTSGSLGITGTALPYLTTFTRTLNAPTYTPSPSRAKVIDPQMASKNLDDQFNPGFLSTIARGTQTFTRPDGAQAVIGEPLLKHRFPLSRLALLTATATCISTVDDPINNPIYTFFGLTRASALDPWVYSHNTAGVKNLILKMGQVQSQAREPDFFELLLASINIGSLGKGWRTYDQNYYYQILQIGANLIDQYDTDSYPTRIRFNNGAVEIAGVESLPFISRIITKFDRDQPVAPSYDSKWIGAAPGPALVGPLGLWFQAEIWNPHQNAATPASGGPTEFRFFATGSVMYSAQYELIADIRTTPWTATQSSIYSNVYMFPTASASSGIQFGLSKVPDRFATPTLLTPSNITSASDSHDNTTDIGDPAASVSGTSFVGLYTPGTETTIPINDPLESYWSHPTNPTIWFGGGAIGAFSDSAHQPLTFLLQYKDSGGNWITYTSINNTIVQMGGNGGISRIGTAQGQIYKADPRSLRFGYCTFESDYSLPTTVGIGNTLHSDYSKPGWPGSNHNWGYTSISYDTSLQGTSVSSYPGFVGDYYGYFTENNTTDRGYTTGGDKIGPNYYADPDGVIRPGDAAYASGSDGQPLQIPAATNPSRPIILNRPFRSVAEMGYAFRDDPWRTLDFFTSSSADSALLDVFCLNEQTGPALTAGVFNLNTRQQPVLKAVLSSVLKDQANPGSMLSASDADNIASLIASTTAASPMQNRSELATKISPVLTFGSSTDAAIKGRRESVARALADAGDTRTWNLLIDVIAQNGRFPVSSTTADQFRVEGENRYWLHVAIDRFTGQEIDRYLEVVNE